ncbi:hypothetical protein LSH36_723g01028 [Paralvinella palmiformis]|uniref:Uncharacterized protein n=1 Tax=Paralvinella palmiformis TaxID=53620 RepID=A0AAD9J1Z4_9ANNE|nr:hypothetical protein LSH36_723g01028 [Paralvinella palmiformis]
MNPEIPGFCVKEKDLQPCFATRDCAPNAKCVSLGPRRRVVLRQETEDVNRRPHGRPASDQRTQRQQDDHDREWQGRASTQRCHREAQNKLTRRRKTKQKINNDKTSFLEYSAKCDDNSDCRTFEKPGGAQLCCQRVARGRQGIKRICDRVTAISKCIAG